MTTLTQSTYAFGYEETFWSAGSFAAYDDYGYCLGATASETTETNGDVVITCEPFQLGSTDGWITNEYRFWHDQKLTRHVFALENRGSSALDLAPVDEDNYLYFLLELVDDYDNSASSSNPTSCASMTADDHWAVVAGTSDTTIAGMAWQAAGGTAFTTLGTDCTSARIYAYFTKASIAAGETVNYMTFIATSGPADGSSSAEMDTAFAAAVSGMSAFDSLNDTLCRGIDGLVIEGWGTCPASLPDTGANSAAVGSSVSIGFGLLIAGALALVMARRREARS